MPAWCKHAYYIATCSLSQERCRPLSMCLHHVDRGLLLSMYSGFSYFGWIGRWSPQYGIFDAYNDPSGKPCSKRFFVPMILRNFVKEV